RAIDVGLELVAEAGQDAPDDSFVLKTQVATGAIGHGVDQIADLDELVGGGLGAAHPAEQVGQGQPVPLARRALAAGLDGQEAGDPGGYGCQVVAVVEDDEASGAEPAADR